MNQNRRAERAGHAIFLSAALLCILSIIAIFAFLIGKSIPFFGTVHPMDFLFGSVWSPDRSDTYASQITVGSYGIFPMLISTLICGISALTFGGTLGCLFAVFLVFFCPRRLKSFFSSLVLLLAGIPSVVYGFFGISFLLPLLSRFAPTNGSGLFATTLILGTMILPTVVALFQTALEAVPKTYYHAAIGLGATHTQAVFCTMVPAARSGRINALVLGLGRALGETMAVILVAGNAPTYPKGLFRSFRVLTANIAMEMGYAGEVQEGALIATGCVLLILILVIHLLLEHRMERTRFSSRRFQKTSVSGGRLSFYDFTLKIQKYAMFFSVLFVLSVLVILPTFLLGKGLPAWFSSPSLLFGKFRFGDSSVTILPSLITTLMTALLCLLIAVPIGVMTAVYLHEYSSKNRFTVRTVRRALGILGGVPSIVYGLFGMMAFVPLFGGSASILAGSLTVSMLLLPTVTRATEESLVSVESGQREGSYALGAGKTYTVLHVVLPAAFPGILSAILLSLGRILSESAPFLYTMGSVLSAIPRSYLDSGTTLASALYQLAGEGWHIEEAFATATVLLLLVLLLNFLTERTVTKLRKKKASLSGGV
ncbi:MAG: phosphate ABC transporter permease subunit PstC [Ruminococcaceae bacterium]|nr:phosphate ABC transporter permease subunit PstC [Oscillospiraceae bacterium]